MAEPIVISRLKKKQEELRRRMADLEKQFQAFRKDLLTGKWDHIGGRRLDNGPELCVAIGDSCSCHADAPRKGCRCVHASLDLACERHGEASYNLLNTRIGHRVSKYFMELFFIMSPVYLPYAKQGV